MTHINLLYASTEGNTKSFVEKLKKVAIEQGDTLNARLIGDETEYANETEPFFALVPTYLTGGTGTGPEVTEIFTNALGEYIDFGNNARYLKGVVGSGNRNFNVQFNLTAIRYAKKFNVPMIAAYELRGSVFDAEIIYNKIKRNIGEQ
ncbi:MAG: class Ib ribonucleoside-diphosphate reductase assembly flavoprotein NrdI [Leuconostoc pseudomesenteroides]|jgi:protein involved in ribonucleotide reduction|uniref:class Ib ribonucleoside-diphosphate reductase assembly flavoprotein NrdI n=1 Tax=Leuconostoc pseudomesenteroides TaxID=33968 RepID=UPI001E4E6386|nr:class Ib ribonucleoside-diphosphate reductase assembly flavoprotein NrdI [Leuconostoc pseudomesenteroides]MCC7668720.1 class Ib ribonucleoside-diphosphate reductase assembly flavoprotein NrdI [Leuconostoc pseudomesenteroides]